MKLALVILAAMFGLMANSAIGRDYKLGSIEIVHPWSRATPKGARVASGYVTIINTGTAPDRLIGGTAFFADRFEIHEMSMDRGVMKMRELPGGLEIKAGATVELKPGSSHIMFQDLARPLAKGERIKGTLVFEKAGTVEVEYDVEAIGSHPASHTGAETK